MSRHIRQRAAAVAKLRRTQVADYSVPVQDAIAKLGKSYCCVLPDIDWGAIEQRAFAQMREYGRSVIRFSPGQPPKIIPADQLYKQEI